MFGDFYGINDPLPSFIEFVQDGQMCRQILTPTQETPLGCSNLLVRHSINRSAQHCPHTLDQRQAVSFRRDGNSGSNRTGFSDGIRIDRGDGREKTRGKEKGKEKRKEKARKVAAGGKRERWAGQASEEKQAPG